MPSEKARIVRLTKSKSISCCRIGKPSHSTAVSAKETVETNKRINTAYIY